MTAGFFAVFGVAPARGRVFTAEEDRPGGANVVVLSDRLWNRRFGSDPAIVGKEVRLDGQLHQVLGIMPAAFDFTARSEELWVPMAFTAERRAMHDEHQYRIYARLAPGATVQQALAELERNAPACASGSQRSSEIGFTGVTVMEELVGDYRRRLFVLLGAVGLVLLIACGNIANLLLARGAARSGELAMRAALGAGRGRIVRQLLTESLLLAALAAVGGLALAGWGINALVAAAPPGVPRLEQASIDPVVLAFTAGVTLVSAIVSVSLRRGRRRRTSRASSKRAGEAATARSGIACGPPSSSASSRSRWCCSSARGC